MVKPQDREVSSVEDLVTKGQSTASPKVAIWRVPPTSRYRCTGAGDSFKATFTVRWGFQQMNKVVFKAEAESLLFLSLRS